MAKQILILNGPNLNLTGIREPEIYGLVSFEQLMEELRGDYPDADFHYRQSHHEGELISVLHLYRDTVDGVLVNAGAYAHTSIALADAIKLVEAPVIEIHLSNIAARESYRHHSFITPVCKGLITGLGMEGYKLGIQFFLGLPSKKN